MAAYTVGAECQIELVPKPSPYTGIFRTGALGLARLSVIKPGTSFSPGSAFKFFVDGRPSLNIVTFRSAMGQGHNCNFFAFAQSNKISREFRPPVTVVKWMVQLALPRIDSPWLRRWDVLPVRHFGMITRKGEIEGAPRAPFEMIFQPTKEVQQSSDPTPDFRIKLRAIPAGATLFRVLARDTEGDETTTEIGVIRTASPFKSSRYGDERLFFQHDDGRSRKVAPA